MKKYPVLSDTLGLVVTLIFIIGIGAVLGLSLYTLKISTSSDIILEETVMSLPDVAVAADEKSVINVKTKEIIFTIDEAQAYLEQAGLAYDSETFETTDAKYAGDSFNQIALSNDRKKIIFSTYGLAGDMPQSWVGVYELVITDSLCDSGDREDATSPVSACIGDEPEWQVRFLTGGSGINFVWSQDDSKVVYDADLGLTGFSMEKTIDINTGEIVITENCEEYENKSFDSEYECYKWLARANKDESLCDNLELPEMRSDCYVELAMLKNDYSICENNEMTAALGSDCAEYFGLIDKGGRGGVAVAGTEDWNWYKSSFFGYEIGCPTGWKKISENAISVSFEPSTYDAAKAPGADCGIASVTVEQNLDNLDLDSWLTDAVNHYSQAEADEINRREEFSGVGVGYAQSEIEVAGKKGIDQYLDGPGGSERYVFVPREGQVIVISFKSDLHFDSSREKGDILYGLLGDFDKMLSTFRFIDK